MHYFAIIMAAQRRRCPVTVSSDDTNFFAGVAQFDSDLMQAGMRIRRLETQEIPVVQIIVEIVHPQVEALVGLEQFILAARHCCDRLGDVLSHTLSSHEDGGQQVQVIRFRLVVSAHIVKNLG